MMIRRKLGLSFGVILVLFGMNLAIYFWSATLRNRTVDTLQRAISRQTLISKVYQTLNNLRQQVTLLSGISEGAGNARASPSQQQEFDQQLEGVSQQLRELKNLANPGERAEFQNLQNTYEQLARSWKVYYLNFGVNPDVAIVELAVRGDPLSEQVLKNLLPHLQEAEQQRVSQAKADFSKLSRLLGQVTVIIFLSSLLVAVIIAVGVSRDLVRSIGDLILGTSNLSIGNLDHRIPLRTADELGQLAQSFNEMASSLSTAREKLNQRGHELEKSNQQLVEKNVEIEEQKQVSEMLMHNILPVAVAEELKANGKVAPKYFEDVTILFTDFVGFTKSSEKLAVEDLIRFLNDVFTTFDRVVKKYGLEKLKTIGDAYMCAGGIPTRNSSHPVDAVLAAFEILDSLAVCNQLNCRNWPIRIGIHTGPVAAGVVGIDKFAFDVWGDTVNFAARIQATSQPNRINISGTTFSRVKDFFDCEARGKIQTKENVEFNMFFANGLHPDFLRGDPSEIPAAFLRRYLIYFSKDPPKIPDSIVPKARQTAGVILGSKPSGLDD